MNARWILIAFFGLALFGCGGGSSPPAGPTGPSAAPKVTINGTYFATDVDHHCYSYADLVSGKTIVFRNAQGEVIGTTTTGDVVDVENVVGGHASPVPGAFGACREWASYAIEVPQESFYQAQVEGRTVGTISLVDLQAKGKFDLETPPSD